MLNLTQDRTDRILKVMVLWMTKVLAEDLVDPIIRENSPSGSIDSNSCIGHQ